MSASMPKENIIDELCELCLAESKNMSWLVEPLTLGRAQAYILQHIIRNRILSSVIRPAWLSRCPDLGVVKKTISQMREELVMDDAIGRAHTELIFEMGRNIGLTDGAMESVTAVPKVEAAFQIWENLSRSRHWIAGWLASSVGEYLIVTVPDNNFRPENWVKALGLRNDQVFFFSYHMKADEEHAGRKVWEPIMHHVHNAQDQKEVLTGARSALEGLSLFYQGVAKLGDELQCNLEEQKEKSSRIVRMQK